MKNVQNDDFCWHGMTLYCSLKNLYTMQMFIYKHIIMTLKGYLEHEQYDMSYNYIKFNILYFS